MLFDPISARQIVKVLRYLTFVFACIAWVSLPALPLRAQSQPAEEKEEGDVATMSFSDLKDQANELLAKGNLIAAKPILEELISRFEHMEGKDKDVDLSSPTFLLAKANAIAYQRTGDKQYLAEAAKWYARFIEKYPTNPQIEEALEAQSAIFAETGNMDKAAEVMKALLKPPHFDKLAPAKRSEILYNLVRVYYAARKFTEGLPWFEKLVEVAGRDENRKAFGAAAAFEAYMEAGKLDEAMALVPNLSGATDTRYRPQLNVAFLRASDQLVGSGRYGDAALVLSLTLTTKQMEEWQTERKALLEQRIKSLEANQVARSTNRDLLQYYKGELRGTTLLLEAMAKMPPLSTDLLARKARNYVKTNRTYEAFWLFYRLMSENPESEQIEFFTYATFSSANALRKTEDVIRIGEDYLAKFPNGRYLEDVTLVMLPHYRETNPEYFAKSARHYLGKYPDNDNAAIVLVQYGQYLISEKKFDSLENEFAELAKKHPDSYYSDGLKYWRGLAALMQRDYDRAFPFFEEIYGHYTNSAYAPESLFRMGVIHFAREEFNESAEKLEKYVSEYPDDRNVDQALYFKAQLAKLAGDTEKAVGHYKQSLDITKSDEMRDMLSFELSDLYVESDQPENAVALMQDYLKTHAETGNISRAHAKLGKAYEATREIVRAVETYESAIKQFAGEKENAGVDEILLDYGLMVERNREMYARTVEFLDRLNSDEEFLRTLVSDRGELFDFFYQNQAVDQKLYLLFRNDPTYGPNLLQDKAPLIELAKSPSEAAKALEKIHATRFLRQQMGAAQGSGDFISELRLAMALEAMGKEVLLSRAPTAEDLDGLTPDTLYYAGAYCRRAGKIEVAKSAWQNLLRDYPVENKAIEAHFGLAELATEAGDLETALTHYRAVHEQFPASPEAPEAILREAATEFGLKRYDKARKLCQRVMRVPTWRGPLHARALYEIGRAFEAEERLGEARGFFERVYLGYSHFSRWAAKSYLADANILRRMNKANDARRILKEAEERLGDTGPQEVMSEISKLAGQLQGS